MSAACVKSFSVIVPDLQHPKSNSVIDIQHPKSNIVLKIYF